jgi:hypothetical protein
MRVKTGMKITGDSNATTLPANMGLLAPLVATVITPSFSFDVVTSHAMILQQRPKIGDRVAAHLFWPFHISVRVAGSTAEEMMTPIKTYNHPILEGISEAQRHSSTGLT